jgi:L-amino acid N-acyltransferase YncA
MTLTIHQATISDLKKIMDIKEQVLINNIKSLDNGFLTADYSIKDYAQILNETEHFYVFRNEQGKIVSFIIGGFNNCSDKIIEARDYIEEPYYFYIKQICVDLEHTYSGIGTETYQTIFNQLIEKTNHIYLSIITKPLNQAAINFHKKLGFKEFKEYQKGEYTATIWKIDL